MKKKQQQQPLFLGSKFRRGGNETDTFVTGGGGYTLNKAALKALVTSFPTCASRDVTSEEDYMVTHCLNQQGIQAFETKDERGADRYLHVNPEFIFNFQPQKILYFGTHIIQPTQMEALITQWNGQSHSTSSQTSAL
jgi:hypothetical protein